MLMLRQGHRKHFAGTTSRIVLILCLILIPWGFVQTAASDKDADFAALLANAQKLENLRSEPAAPFLLRASLAASLALGKTSGQYVLGWADPKQWREVLVLSDFRRVREGAADGYHQVRSQDFQPEVIFGINAAIDVDLLLRLTATEKLTKGPKNTLNGVQLTCASVREFDYLNRKLCFDPVSGLLVHAEITSRVSGDHVVEYSDFRDFGAHKFPFKLKVSFRDGYSLDISVTQLDRLDASQNLTLASDPKTEFWSGCRDGTAPEVAHQTPPIYPQVSKDNHEQGDVVVFARIETDGSLSHLTPLRSAYPALQQATLDALRTWTYTPRKCGDVAVRDEILVKVIYTLSG
jgi:TonB family protein